jgi:hypothetical protein
MGHRDIYHGVALITRVAFITVAQDLETLCTRAEAAALRAKQLREMISASQRRLRGLITTRKMLEFRATDRKISYPTDFPEIQHTHQPFPAQDDEV